MQEGSVGLTQLRFRPGGEEGGQPSGVSRPRHLESNVVGRHWVGKEGAISFNLFVLPLAPWPARKTIDSGSPSFHFMESCFLGAFDGSLHTAWSGWDSAGYRAQLSIESFRLGSWMQLLTGCCGECTDQGDTVLHLRNSNSW